MKRLIMKFSFLTMMSLAIFAMPILANGNGGNAKEGCTNKCIRSTAMCKDQCKDGTPITDMLCRTLCDLQYAGCMLFCPIAG